MKKSGWTLLAVLVIGLTSPFMYAHTEENRECNSNSFIKPVLEAETKNNTDRNLLAFTSRQPNTSTYATRQSCIILNISVYSLSYDGVETGYKALFGLRDWNKKVPDASALKEYTGTFDFVDFPSMEIYLYNGELYGETSHGKSVLKKTQQKDTFEIVDYQSKLTFKRDIKGKIVSVELDAQGFKSTGVKRKIAD